MMLQDNIDVHPPTHLLRQMTSFVGRKQEISEIVERLGNPLCQLLTLVGAGGVGKTRLALEIGQQMSSAYPQGVYFVPLQPLRSAAHIVPTIARVLELPVREHDDPLKMVTQFLRGRQVMLILDNFEHLIDGAEVIPILLADAPDVRILVTSREPLNLYEEWQWVVTGLTYPAADVHDALDSYSAIQLFGERVAQINREFVVRHDCPAVARICQLVEGIPLAIEMAANWTKLLTCDVIAEAIQNNIDFLMSREQNVPERHRSMRAVYNHSWRLLHEDERRVFERLSVFHGGFTVAAAEVVAGANLLLLASLTDKSFLRQDAHGRYDIHELLRQFGAEQLAISGATNDVLERHGLYFAEFVKARDEDIKGSGQLDALNKLEAEFENIRAAWMYAIGQGQWDWLNQMMDSLYWFSETRSFSMDVRALFEKAIAVLQAVVDAPKCVLARLLVRVYQSADVQILDDALAAARECGDQAEVAYCLMLRGVYDTEHRQPQAEAELNEALDLYRQNGDDFGMAVTYLNINYYQGFYCDQGTISASLDLTLQHARKIGNPYHLFKTLFRRAWMYVSDGKYALGEQDFKESLRIATEMGFHELGASCMGSLGCIAMFRGDVEEAKVLAIQNLERVMNLSDVGEQGFAKNLLSGVACMEGDYEAAMRLAEESRVLVGVNLMRQRSAARSMAMAACGLGQFDKALEYAHWALAEELSQGIRMWIMPVFALVLAHQGEHERAAELFGLIFTHPASPRGWFDKWDLLRDAQADLAEQLGAEANAAAWARGSQLELDAVVDDLLHMTDAHATQPALDPLTDRELEVLRMIAQGLTNHEIAESMTVVEGTIRTHVYNLCQKLGVRNRTGAVARARALHLLR